MASLKSSIALVSSSFLLVVFIMVFTGCTKHTPTGPGLSDSHDNGVIAKPNKKTIVEPVDPEPIFDSIVIGEDVIIADPNLNFVNWDDYNKIVGYPQMGAAVCEWDIRNNVYFGCQIQTPNASLFQVMWNALTPPDGTPFAEPVTIGMKIGLAEDGTEMIFSFGPSGCRFDPPAMVELSYKDMNLPEYEAPELYLHDENDQLIIEENYKVDLKGQKIVLEIPHFSRYSLIRR